MAATAVLVRTRQVRLRVTRPRAGRGRVAGAGICRPAAQCRPHGVDPSTDLDSQLRASVAVACVRSVLMAYSIPDTDVPTATAEAFTLVENGLRG